MMAISSHLQMLKYTLVLSLLIHTVTPLVLQNTTLPLPVGTSNHGTPGLLCTPTKWIDIVTFYLFNYIAHAATVLTRPGERSDDFVVTVIGCLMFPALGLYRGIEAILSGAVLVRNDDLRKAARSGALCMVVRGGDWTPGEGELVKHVVFKRSNMDKKSGADAQKDSAEKEENSLHIVTYQPPWVFSKFGCPVYVHRQIIHGTYTLPKGYRFAIVPSDTKFDELETTHPTIEVSATYNVVKALVALAQSGYALLTLYRSRGDQIEQFGFAAFGLTVAPYAVMSIMNLVGNLCRPDYASLYMVENSIMDEARKRGGVFHGSVGKVEEDASMSVCSCRLADGEDVEDLRFSVEAGKIEANFNTTAPPSYTPHEDTNEKSISTTCSSCPSTAEHSWTIKPLPEDMDYQHTSHDALLLIPCSNPIARTNHIVVPDLPTRYDLSSLALKKTWPPFHKHRTYRTTFSPHSSTRLYSRWRLTAYLLTTVIALFPFIINGAMSHFQPGSIPPRDSATWKVCTMQWLVIGVGTGIGWVLDQEGKDASPHPKNAYAPVARALLYLVSASPAVGGFVVVGQMVWRYGVCVWVD